MRWIGKAERGAVLAVAVVSGIAVVGAWVGDDLDPSAGVLQAAAGIGASFVLAYVITASWISTRLMIGKDGEKFVGVLTGLGLAGVIAVIVLLVLSEHDPSSSFSPRDEYLLWWSMVTLVSLGLLVASQPLVTHTWRLISDEDQKEGPDKHEKARRRRK